jgi:hypothetical protein
MLKACCGLLFYFDESDLNLYLYLLLLLQNYM